VAEGIGPPKEDAIAAANFPLDSVADVLDAHVCMAVTSHSNDDHAHDRDKEQVSGESVGISLSPSLVRDSLIILDWDDTILPTSWLERIRALTAGVPLRPEVQRQMANLCAVCANTMAMAQQMGTVVFITNSAPGWVDQSCQLFMPQIYQQVRGYQIFAKPMHAPLTFKLSAFRRECQAFRNLVSVGDGDAERAASLRLLTPPDRKALARAGDVADVSRCVKSVKLIEFPSCQQLIAEHEMLQIRLLDIVTFQGSLDLKARFSGAGFGASPGAQGKASGCTLVHFAGSLGGRQGGLGGGLGPPGRTAQSAGAPVRPPLQEDSGTAASGKMQQGLMCLKQLPPGLRTPAHGLPPLGAPGSPGARGGDSAPTSLGDYGGSLSGLVPPRGGDRFSPGGPGGSGPVEFLSGSAEASNGTGANAPGGANEDLSSSGWRMQTIGGSRGPRSQYQTPTKKRPGLGSPASPLSGIRSGRGVGGAAWRDGSAPAVSRAVGSLS
jgi:hypothetical protein